MNRLTRIKNHYGDYEIIEESFSMGEDENQQCLNKLGQYEDIDEELGIDYITFNKLRKTNKIYYLNDNNEIMEVEVYSIDFMNCYVRAIIISPYVNVWSFKDYGKTWALTREELEK